MDLFGPTLSDQRWFLRKNVVLLVLGPKEASDKGLFLYLAGRLVFIGDILVCRFQNWCRTRAVHFPLAVADGQKPTNNISPAGSVGFNRLACSYVHIECHRLYVLLSHHALSCASRAGPMGRAEVWPGEAWCGLCEAFFLRSRTRTSSLARLWQTLAQDMYPFQCLEQWCMCSSRIRAAHSNTNTHVARHVFA